MGEFTLEEEPNVVDERVNVGSVFNIFKTTVDRPVSPMFDKGNENLSESVSKHIRRSSNAYQAVKTHRLQNPKNVTIGHLNVNSIRNKIFAVEELIKNNIDICLLTETKIDDTFPNQQFNISNYRIMRKDRNKNGGGLLFYINENIPCKVITNYEIPADVEILLFEFSIKNRKWLCVGLYKPPSQGEKYFLDNMSLILSKLMTTLC